MRWVGDITYVRTWGAGCYLTTIFVCPSRRVVGWAMDGGVDIILTKGGAATFVQCKQNTSQLGPSCVRELAGVMASEGVADGIVVACGGVGDEGQAFAKRSGIRIIDGTALLGLLLETGLWTRPPHATPLKANIATHIPSCPRCHADMVPRVSRHGLFWGCSRYPSCRGTRPFVGLHAH